MAPQRHHTRCDQAAGPCRPTRWQFCGDGIGNSFDGVGSLPPADNDEDTERD